MERESSLEARVEVQGTVLNADDDERPTVVGFAAWSGDRLLHAGVMDLATAMRELPADARLL